MRQRLSTLPWVEIRSIKPDQSKLQVTFGVNDKSRVNLNDLSDALGSRYGQGAKILSITDAETAVPSPSSARPASAEAGRKG